LRAALIGVGLKYYSRHIDDLPEGSESRLIEILAWEQVRAEDK